MVIDPWNINGQPCFFIKLWRGAEEAFKEKKSYEEKEKEKKWPLYSTLIPYSE